MSLTLDVEQKMENVGLVNFYSSNSQIWKNLAQKVKNHLQETYPEGSTIRRDDVATSLIPILGVHKEFIEFRYKKKLKEKYWIKHFADLIIDRTWEEINK